MILSILIPVLKQRSQETVACLKKQATRFNDVEVLTEADFGEKTSGTKRNLLTARAKGTYICFVDDDDSVSSDFVYDLRKACALGLDVVTFELEQNTNGKSFHRQAFGVRYQDQQTVGDIVLMKANHLCAWRKEIATKVAWDENLGYGDDQLWYKPLIDSGIILTEYHINKILYHYNHKSEVTANQTKERILFSKQLYKEGVECFVVEDEILIATTGIYITKQLNSLPVRDKHNQVRMLTRGRQQSYVVQIQ